ncbi:sensor histidine kinase [Rubripirellula amarantea]|nr:HAMP domain-containing sensor histidine kinase [Rubripirellula amarantea]
MFERRSLRAPITLGVVMIILVVILTAVWIAGNFLGIYGLESTSLFYALLATGTILLAVILAGVIAYLTLTVKAFNLNRRQSNFIDAVTHELKSPIASLKLYLQTMNLRVVDEQQQKDFHQFMLEDVERLDSLISHLLDAARIERGGEPASEEIVRLDDLLRQCGEATCARYRLSNETVDVKSDPIYLRSQLIQLEILFRNLIDNAVKYGGSPPEVEVSTRVEPNNQVSVYIRDNGAGIPANQRRKIFGRFVRLGSELERSTPGTGLGLYLVRTVTKELGGTVRVGDRSEGSGTQFEVTLGPVVAADTASPSDVEVRADPNAEPQLRSS